MKMADLVSPLKESHRQMKLLLPLVGGVLVDEKEQTKEREMNEWGLKNWGEMVGGLVGENETNICPRAKYSFNLMCASVKVYKLIKNEI